MHDFSIVVCAFNEEHNIKGCLRALRDQDMQGYSVELIVIDNSSQDQTYALAKAFLEDDCKACGFCEIRLVEINHVSLSGSRNCGLGLAQGRWIIFVDADGYAAPDWFSKLASHCRDPRKAVGGRVRPIISNDNRLLDKFCTQILTNNFDHQQDIIGASMAIKMSQIGDLKFADNLPRGEESEFLERILVGDANQKFIAQDADYFNHFPDTFKLWLKITFREGICRYRISKWRQSLGQFRFYNASQLLVGLSVFVFPITYFLLALNYVRKFASIKATSSQEGYLRRLGFSFLYPLFFYCRRFGWAWAFINSLRSPATQNFGRCDADFCIKSIVKIA